jgi:DNA-binding MarR family transcriptional regulator
MPRPSFDLERHVFFWMTQVMGSRDRRLGQALKPFGLRVPEWRVLASLCARRRLSMSELADLASIDRTTLSRTVDRLVQARRVARLSDAEDMRVTRLALTAAGEKLFQRMLPAVEELNRAAIAELPEGAVEMLRWTLGRMKSSLDAAQARAREDRAPARAA